MIFVVDASVVVKWVLKEEYTDDALLIRDRYIDGKIKLYAPPLIRYEVANAIWKAVRKKILDKLDAVKALENLIVLLPRIIKLKRENFLNALNLAIKYAITVYDAVYIVLRDIVGGVFITADRKLFDKVKKLKNIIFISDIKKHLS